MKPFDLEKAKAGAPVCTRDGKKVRIICFDAKVKTYKIVALVEDIDNTEHIKAYTNDGSFFLNDETLSDLMMATTKHEGWVNIYPKEDNCMKGLAEAGMVYESEDKAIASKKVFRNPIATVKIEWEE